ncbi:hypothetical protein ACFL6C_03440 [Myxococcota bacterium]
MSQQQLSDLILFDKRLIERHIAKGLITRKDVEKRLSETEDLGDQAEWMSLEELRHPDRANRPVEGVVAGGDSPDSKS